MRGRYYWGKRGSEGLGKAIDYLNRAIERDSTFARAHAGLSMAYAVLPVFESIEPDSAMDLAERSAARALALDSSLAEAHLALAYSLKNRWRFVEAEREFRAALALAPSDPGVHHWYGVFLYATGRAPESVNILTRARELDPFSTSIGTDGAVALYAARRFREARQETERTHQLDSTRSDNALVTAWSQLALGFPDSAIASLERSRRQGTGFDVRSYLSVAYRRLGDVKRAEAVEAELARDYARGRALAYDVAVAAAGAGEIAKALEALEQTLAQRSLLVTELSLPCDVLFDPLRSDPRFEQSLARAGMQPCRPTPPPADTSAPRSPGSPPG